jgi:hypothetical protein
MQVAVRRRSKLKHVRGNLPPANQRPNREAFTRASTGLSAELNLDMLIDSELLPAEVVETAIRVNQQMLDVMTAGASGMT